ncbi:MAG TPA: enoyl-CoA hydratase-related protein [Candidatus Binataceae bacterium]|nr:enoyl-CoA hydratase-related protein [Candidatus Binataceae bacterium]
MAFETLLYEVADEIATIRLNRPAKMNAYTPQMGREIVAAMRQADEDRKARVVILTGAGRAFCAGADISTFDNNIRTREGGGNPPSSEGREAMHSYPHLMRTMSKPSIVAINGYALGVGATMTLPCDIRIMAEGAKLGFIFPRVGLMTELGSSYFLPRLVGVARASEMLLTGRHYSAQECLAMGVVSHVTTPDTLMTRAHEIAGEIIQGSPTSLALTRRALHNGVMGTLENALEFEAFALDSCYTSPEHKEYVTAFMEKRKPDLSRIRK